MRDLRNKTKELIFSKSIELFSMHGYENVSMKEIAASAGITAPSIYNHYKTKAAILDDIYDYYEENYFANWKTEEEVEAVLKKGTVKDIVRTLAWTFRGLPAEMERNLGMGTKIIYARFLIDERAKGIFYETMIKRDLVRTESALRRLVSLGRMDSSLDIKSYAEIITYANLMPGTVAMVHELDKEAIKALGEDKTLKNALAELLSHNID